MSEVTKYRLVSIDAWRNEMCDPFIEILNKNTGEPLLAFTTIHGSE